jgi:tryptophan-rich sensory protein
LFFGLQRPDLAFVDILLLLGAIVWTMTAFARVDRTAAGLLVPYLLWVAFAAGLNGVLWRLNA